eukprot:1131221-Pelagomonas_calceolata.AAC.2
MAERPHRQRLIFPVYNGCLLLGALCIPLPPRNVSQLSSERQARQASLSPPRSAPGHPQLSFTPPVFHFIAPNIHCGLSPLLPSPKTCNT